jgi:hypothetical protein
VTNRIAALGQGPGVSRVVLADPEGNEFCPLQGTGQEAAQEEAAG